MSKIEVNEIDAQSGTTITVGSACKSVAVPGNVVKTNAVQASDAGNIISQSGTTITIGASGDTVSLASGASQSGFGRSGSVDWQTGSIKTSTFTAVSGEGYFINSGSAITVNLPAGSAGAIVAVSDYARNFSTYNLTISPNGSEKIGGVAEDAILNVDGQAATLVYVDSTKGWVNVQNAEDTETGKLPYIEASGGTETTCGNFKIHTFTAPGTFTVSSLATAPANNAVAYAVVGAGGGGGKNRGGGGGAGGFREGTTAPIVPYTASPLVASCGVTVSVQGYPIIVGGGGAKVDSPGANTAAGTAGNTSSGLGISSAGGGGGGSRCRVSGTNGGSGGGAGSSGPGGGTSCGGSGNTPPVSPAQGKDGGDGGRGSALSGGMGGGGATVQGSPQNVNVPSVSCSTYGRNRGAAIPSGAGGLGGDGGQGATTSITGSAVGYAGGGGGGASCNPPVWSPSSSLGGTGGMFGNPGSGTGELFGGANGGSGDGTGPTNVGANAADNKGGGGGGGSGGNGAGGNGGSGVVIIRYRFQ